MKQLIRNVKIIGTGSYVPETIYTNEYLETILPTSAQWIYENVGIKERRVAAKNQATSDLATIAGQRAIENAGLQSADIDLIIVATATSDRKAPSTAAFVQHKLNAVNAAAFDITAVCSGFLFGMSVATQYIASGVYNKWEKVIDVNIKGTFYIIHELLPVMREQNFGRIINLSSVVTKFVKISSISIGCKILGICCLFQIQISRSKILQEKSVVYILIEIYFILCRRLVFNGNKNSLGIVKRHKWLNYTISL